MDEYYPIIVEGDLGAEHAKSVKNKLHIHFQSKKKSQGGDCVVQYNDKSDSATILFKSSDIRDAVLSQAEHIITIDSKKIKLKVFKPSDVEELADNTGQRVDQACGYQEPNESTPQTELDVKTHQESSVVVLENLPDDVKQDVLTLLVENITSLSENDFTIELIRKAVVTFKNPIDAGKFLEDSRTHEKFKKNNLRARTLERSTCVRVENLPDEANNNKMLLEKYFEKWGGPVEEVITIPSEQAAIITFKEEEAKERVLKQENNICDVPVNIYPYFKSLDTVLYGGNRPHLKLPDPITVSVHPAIREFLLKKGEISSIKDQMSSHFCQINMEKPEVLLSPDPALLKQKRETRRHVDGWSKNACDAFMKIMSNYTTSEWPVSHPLWSKMKKDVMEVVKDKVFTDLDASKGVLTLAGMTHEIIGLKPIMEKILERATNQIEREKNSVTEQMEMSPAMYSLLLQDGLKSAVSPHLHIDYNKKMNRLNLSGLHTETLTFKNWALEKKINMKQKPLKIDRSILEFLRSVNCDEMSTDLFISHGITAVYTIENGDVVLTGSTEKALVEAEKRVNMVLTSKDLIIEDQGVLQMTEWQDLKKQLQKSFNTSKNISVFVNLSQRDKVIVTGFRDPVMEVSENLGRFIEKHTKIEETVRVKSHAVVEFIKDRKTQDWQHIMKSDKIKVKFDSKRPRIKLSGERRFVQPAMTFFKRLADSLHTDTHIIKKAGVKKYFKEQGKMMLSMLLKEKRFVVVLQEDDMLEQEEDVLLPGPIGRVSTCPGMDSMQVYGQNQSIFRRSSEKVEEDKYLLTKFKESPTNEEFVMVVEKIEPAVFQLCGETSEDLREAKDMIHSFIVREHLTIPIRDPAIAHFTKEAVEMLNSMQREFTVSVQLEKKGRDSVVTLEGLTRDVHSAESRIRDVIRKVERNEYRRREAFIISSMVKWQYQENGRNLKNFDMLTNYELEEAYQKRQPSVRIKINNDDYEADLVRKEATRGRMKIELNRVDLKDAAAAAAQSPLPSHWEDMKGKSVVLVKLTAGSNEYNEVEKEFRRTNLTSNIIEIETVQNSALWRNYMIKKEEMEEKNKHKNNEKRLFHGTGPDKTDQINHHGFNRSFSGMHGAIYGNGTYFAVDPSYSARGYSNPYVRGVKRMYLARVLVGDFTQGKQGLPVPPRKSSNSADLYNSVTDNINNPSMFVVFNDVQAYPEYLITFQ
ncbi:protein mono-ADP-ribosyltransferase PARP14 isoform X24 [Ctenopharyngodon idella]|uniref:protein mono-ADP-ribosyltransferase PARP14 isoform X24 n=1 Tax=Ctenopharyngodon idella TaxID=7959 RepID=UPI00222E38A1|nr:protein mono-ADP-ribosyltransferase PARP14 isoform X24 [Ctenopharyngodon idella]